MTTLQNAPHNYWNIMHITEQDGTAVLQIRNHDDEVTVRHAITRELRRGYRVDAYDDVKLISSIWKTPVGFAVRRDDEASHFHSAHEAAVDAARGLMQCRFKPSARAAEWPCA